MRDFIPAIVGAICIFALGIITLAGYQIIGPYILFLWGLMGLGVGSFIYYS